MTAIWTLTWVAGPDSGGTAVLGLGTHIVGRAQGAAARCDDPALEPHHLLIEISSTGARISQLTGRVPVRVDGEPLDDSVSIAEPVRFELGHSLLEMCPGDLTAPAHGANPANITVTAAGSVLVRCPRSAARWDPEPLTPPPTPAAGGQSSGGLLPAFLALAGSGLVAVLLHQPMFLVFGVIGAFVAFGTWGGHRINLFHRRRRDAHAGRAATAAFDAAVESQRAGFIAHHVENDSTPTSARRMIEGLTAELWSRRATHPDALAVSVGLGNVAWAARLQDSNSATGGLGSMANLADLPLVTHVGASCRLAIRGSRDRARSVVRSMLLQLAANCGPADFRVIAVTAEPARWRWLEHLPHATTATGLVAVIGEGELFETVAGSDVAPRPHLVIVTDMPELLAARTSPLRRVVVAGRSTALIVLVETDDGIPHVCTSLLDLCGPMNARWHADAALASLPVQARCFGISERSAMRLVRCLSGLIDPEDLLGGVGGIPLEVNLLSLLASYEPAAIAASWVSSGVDPPPRTVIGMAGDGVVDVDLDRDGPHALMAGTTGAGKSELLRTLVAGLAVASSPDHLTFVLIDYKGGSTFDACARLPHVVGLVTDLDEHLANRALRSLHAELRRRELLLRGAGAADLAAYRRLAPHEVLPRLVVVIDEFASLVSEQPDFLHALVGIAQRGRSLGVHLILATQRPSGVISDDIRANTNLRLALRLHDVADALDVVGDATPAAIPRGLAGRAVMRLGPDEVLTFQTARSTSPVADGGTELDLLVDAVRDASVLVGSRPPATPWLAPLPACLPVDAAAVSRGVIGIVDDPDGQRVSELRWTRSDGHLLLFGALGSGVTSTLVLLGTVAATDGSGSHIYVIDGRGDEAWTRLERSPWCGAVVRIHERERLIRLINRLADEVRRRMGEPSSPSNPIVVLVDGLDALRVALDDLDTAAESEMLESIITHGPSHGVVMVCGVDRVGAVPLSVLGRCAQRWVFHLFDPLDAVGLGVSSADVPGPQPGRVLIASSGLEAQVVVGEVPLPSCVDGSIPMTVDCLPPMLLANELPPGQPCTDDSLLPIGVAFGDGRACNLAVPDGEHVLIIGPSRSGRSTALKRIVQAWLGAHPGGWWRVLAPRRTVFGEQNRYRTLEEIIDDVPTAGPVLIAIDDSELVDDVAGALAKLASSRRPGLVIVCTGKPDSLRQSYGHWTGIVRRSRLGIVTAASNDLDGDLLGAVLPRRMPIVARPGLGWLVANGDCELVQVAVDVAGEFTLQKHGVLSNRALL
ncbi:MAG: segregation ATPase FtsK/SpoIIIE, family [Ilumatobacteraceae bacterium]